MKITKDNIKAILFIALCIILMFAVLWHLDGLLQLVGKLFTVIEPIIIGFCMAFVFNIPMSFLEQKVFAFLLKPDKKGKTHEKLARLISVLLTLIIFIGTIALLLLVIIPQVIDTVTVIISSIPAFTERAITFTQELLSRFDISSHSVTEFLLDGKEFLTTAGEFIKQNLNSFLLSARDIGTSVVSGVISVFLGMFIAIYFLLDKEKMFVQIRRLFFALLSPTAYSNLAHIVALSGKSFTNFISGQFIEAIILGCLCFSGMLVFDFPYALVISVLVGVSALIPILGAWIGGGISALLILINSPVKALWFLVFFIVLQQLENNLIYPRVVGKQVGLPGVWVLLAIVIGTNIMGAFGAILAVPLASVIYVLLSEFVASREKTP